MTRARTVVRLVTLFISLLPWPAAAQSPGHLYVTIPGSNAVAEVDTSTNTVVNTIQILPPTTTGTGSYPLAAAVTPDGHSLYVANEACTGLTLNNLPGTVSVIDIFPNSSTYDTVIATIGVGLCPTSIAFTPDGTRAYVTNSGFLDGTVSVIDTQAHTLLANITVDAPTGNIGPEGLVINPQDGLLYLADYSSGLDVLNTATNSVVSRDFVFNGATLCADYVALMPNDSQLYVSCHLGHYSVVNLPLSSTSVAYSSPLDFCTPGEPVIAPDGKHVYMVDYECLSLGVIDTNTNATTFVNFFNPGFTPYATTDVAITPDSKTAYVGGEFYLAAAGSTYTGLVAIDTVTLSPPTTFAVRPFGEYASGLPGRMAFAPANTPMSNPPGAPVTVQPMDLATGKAQVTVTFSAGVTQAGFTDLVMSSTGSTPPAGFQLGSPAVYYDLSTTAQYPPNITGSITVCINYTGISFSGTPALFHYENGGWVNQTSAVPFPANTVCGTVSSLSPFALFAPEASQAPLTITANNATRQYGAPDPAFSVSYSGFMNGDGPGSLSGTLNCTPNDTAASPAGIYAINCSGLSSPNYAINYVAGTLTITPAPLMVVVNNASRPYGANNPLFTGAVTGLLNSDPLSVNFGTLATPASPVGMYAIVPTVVGAPGVLSNYTVTLVNGTLSVVPESTLLTLTFAPPSIPVGLSTTATVTLTAPDMVIPIPNDPSVLAPITVSSPVLSDILSSNGVCTPVPSASPGVASCTVNVTSVEPNGRTFNASFPGSANLTGSSGEAELMVTAALLGHQTCLQSDFRNVAVAGGNYLWFNSIFKVRDVTKQTINLSFYKSSVQFQYQDGSGNLVTVNQALPDARIVIDPNAPTASTTFDAVNNVWLTTIPFDLDDNSFLTGIPWLVPAGGIPADVEPVTWCGTFASDVAGLDIGWRWAAAGYSSFSSDNASLGVKPMDTDKDNPPKNHDRAGTPETFKPFVIPGARGKGGTNYTGTYSRSKEIE